MRAAVESADGTSIVDLDDDELVETDAEVAIERRPVRVDLPLVVAADATGALVIAVVKRRPPLVVSHDAGSTWRETGHGLPPGRAVAVSPDHPDLIVFASENRLYVSRDGGRFWQPLATEFADIRAVAWLQEV